MKDASIFKPELMQEALKGSILKLNPVSMLKNPVMFIVEIGSVVTTAITLYNLFKGEPYAFNLQISLWLWFTVIFANFAEALAEGKGKAQAESLKKSRSETFANKVNDNGKIEVVPALALRKGRVLTN
jgi:K+-transporting ATPase ATPase B chain